jgi:peptide/nickel transport system substrate-binding protein
MALHHGLTRRAVLAGLAASATLPAVIARASPAGRLRLAIGNGFPKTLYIPQQGGLTIFGMAESLMRLDAETFAPQPWLAESVTRRDALTWDVKLRANATFHDGSPVLAEDVVRAIGTHLEEVPGNALLLSKDVRFEVVSPLELTLTTPTPTYDLLYVLAAPEFAIFKGEPDQTSLMTGPYVPQELVPDDTLRLVPHEGHWAGPAPIAEISLHNIVDANTRLLALQSGEVDMVWGLTPEQLSVLGAGMQQVVYPTTRIHYFPLNHRSFPFSDLAVRQAVSLATDRQEVLDAALSGAGAPLTGLLPDFIGVPVANGVRTDVAAAERLLDEAGWMRGQDGVRTRDGRRLSFVINGWPNRAELIPMAVNLAGQLARVGIEASVVETADIRAVMEQAEGWSMATYSSNTMSAGPMRIFFNTLVTGAAESYGGYSNPELDALMQEVRAAETLEAFEAGFLAAQEMVLADMANLYLIATPWGAAWAEGKLVGYVPHPSDRFFVDHSLSVAS